MARRAAAPERLPRTFAIAAVRRGTGGSAGPAIAFKGAPYSTAYKGQPNALVRFCSEVHMSSRLSLLTLAAAAAAIAMAAAGCGQTTGSSGPSGVANASGHVAPPRVTLS